MKKLLNSVCIIAIIIVSCTIFSGCKDKNVVDVDFSSLTTYEINAEFDEKAHTISASQSVTFVNNSEDMLKNIYFHLYANSFKKVQVAERNIANCYYNGESYGKIDISRITIGGVDYQNYDATGELLKLDLDTSLQPQKSVEICFEYEVQVPNCTHRFGYGENTYNLNNFYPVVCVYDGGWNETGYSNIGDPFYSEVANFNVSFKANSDIKFAFSGTADISTTGNYTTYKISEQGIRDFAILGGNFKTLSTSFKNTQINYYYFDDSDAQSSLNTALNSINTFSAMFLEYPYDTYNVVQADFCFGGMEYPLLTMISASVTNKDEYLNCIVHETAHQWWYSLVGNNEFDEAWLDESLTEYSTALFYNYNTGYNYTYQKILEKNYSNYELFVSVYTDVFKNVDTSMNRALDEFNSETEYVYAVYIKGTLMYDSLNNIVGSKKLLKALKNYAHQYAYKLSTEEDLINSFSKSTKTDLNSFFDSWLNGKVSFVQ